MTRRRILVGGAAAALILLLGRWSSALYTEHLWFSALGAESLWRASITTRFVLTAGSFVLATLFAFVNLYAVRHSVVSLVLPRRIGNLEIGEEVPGSYLHAAAVVLSLAAGALLTFPSDKWPLALLATIGQPFGETDPYFGADLSFFVYWLPLEMAVHVWAVIVLVTVIVLVVALYALTPSLRWQRGSLYVSAYVRRHFMVLGAVLLLALSWSYRLGLYRLLAGDGGRGDTFTMLDHRVAVPAMLLLSVVTLCAALVVGWAGWTGQMRIAFWTVSAVMITSLAARTIAPLMVRRSIDPAEQVAQERPYLATRLGFTRRAYGVDRMRAESLGAGFATLAEAGTRVAIWDGATLARVGAWQRGGSVVAAGVSWEAGAAGVRALLVERTSNDSAGARSQWVIDRYDPTSADARGAPVRVGPNAQGSEPLAIPEPAVFDSAPAYSVLSDSLRQLAGVEMSSTRSRLVHAWSLQNVRLLFGELPGNRPTMMRRRAVRDRVRALAPFFVQGTEVVPIVAADSLYWIIELYAASATYPLSQRFVVLGAERGYLLHAATAVVHAASGRVRIALANAPDPVSASWAAHFPRLFTRVGTLSPAVQRALPPVADGARTQALAFAAAGFRGDSFEVRHFAIPDGADSAAAREPARIAFPSIDGVSSLWPLLDSADRVRGVVAASAGAVRSTLWIPMASDGSRWGRVVDRMRSSDSTQRDVSLVRSTLRVVPVAGRPLFVQPVFQARSGGAPTLLRVVALANDTVRVAPTLMAAVGVQRPDAASRPATSADVRARMDLQYREMRRALERGDWSAFGRAFDSLGVEIRRSVP